MVQSIVQEILPQIDQRLSSSRLLKWWQKKEQIQALRRQGLSYLEIRAKLPFTVSKGTVSRWCKDITLTPEQLDRLDQLFEEGKYRGRLLGSKTHQLRPREEVAAIKNQARAEVSQLTQKELWVAGLMLYWAEGVKFHAVGVSNSDPSIIQFMVWWLKKFCGLPHNRFRIQLPLHSGQKEGEMKRFWPCVTKIPLSQLQKSFVKPEGSGHRKNRLYYGTVAIRVSDGNSLHRILGWIEGFCERSLCLRSSIGRATRS